MIEKNKIEELVKEFISDKDIFLIDVKVSSANKITVLANKKDGITIDDCVMISRHLENSLDREEEDFELQVSSSGLDMPFLVREQYEMNIGKRVSVTDNKGKKYKGVLESLTDDGFDLKCIKKERGKKKQEVSVPFCFIDIRSVKVVLTFK
ncbi:MAG: ribosome assembly cofactor RimP [Bacteroidales bacterium]|nr:ribosome assembly cofactor RimP [Bacteroidales bacterium]